MNDIALSGLAKQLVAAELITDKNAQQAYQQAQRNRVSLVSYLVQNKLVKSRQVAEIASEHFGVALLDLSCLDKESQPKGLVSEKLIRQHHVLPLWRRGNKLFVGISDPSNHQAITDIQFSTGLTTEAILVEDDKLADAIDKFFDNNSTGLEEMGDVDLEGLDIESVDDRKHEQIAGQDADDAPVVRFVNKMLLDAIKGGSSDLHFEPYEKIYRVRLRTDGILREVARPPIHLASRIAARLKVMASMDISERRKPQDGRIKMRISKTKAIDFRVNTLPTLWGEKVVMRILDPSSAQMGIDALGYEPDQKILYMEALKQPQGMILVTGPTGSGKTVSLYTGLNILNTVDINISTAEDPVEINMEGINQVNVNPKQGLDFAQALRSFLRQDPDVIMVGEIRDLETAEMAIQAALTGHLVLSTLHTNDAPSAISRLLELGVPHYLIKATVLGVMAQRLVRTLCPHCKAPTQLEEDDWQSLTRPWQAPMPSGAQRAVGCLECRDTGYRGRAGVYEILVLNDGLKAHIHADTDLLALRRQAFKDGMRSLRLSGAQKVAAGLTTVEEVLRVTPQSEQR